MKKGLLLYLCMGAVAFTPLYGKSPNVPAPGFKRHPGAEVVKPLPQMHYRANSKSGKIVQAPERYSSVGEQSASATIKLLKCTNKMFEQGYSAEYTYEYSYDEYGYRAKRACPKLNLLDTYTYQWYVPGEKWSRRETQPSYPQSKQVDERTFHANGSVDSWVRTIGDEPIFKKNYDENGYLVKEDDCNGYVSEYVYFPLTREWLKSSITPSDKTIYTIDGDSYVKEYYYGLSDGDSDPVYELSHKIQRWFNENGEERGELSIYYDGGEITNASGNRNETVVDGDKVYERYCIYEMEISDWRVMQETVKSLNFDQPWVYDKDAVYSNISYEYNYDSQKLEKTYETTYVWIKPGFMKCHYKDYEDSEEYDDYLMIDENGEKSHIYYDPSTGDYAVYEEVETDGDIEELYTYYDANGNVTLKIKVVDNVWQQWNGSSWTSCKGEVTVHDGTERTVAEFNSAGQLVKLTEYDEDGVSIDGVSEYKYFANGYEVAYWYYIPETTTLYKETVIKREVNGDIETEVEYTYDYNGNLNYARKEDYDTKQKLHTGYSYNEYSNEWTVSGYWVEPLEEILPNGMTQLIERRVDDEGKIFNFQKSITKHTDEGRYEEYYEWDNSANKWIGTSRRETYLVAIPEFKVITPADPTIGDADYFIPNVDEEVDGYVPDNTYSCYRDWTWDYSSDSWKVWSMNDESFTVNGNTMVHKSDVSYGGDDSASSVETIVRDEAYRILSRETVSVDNSGKHSSKIEYSYDADGRLIKHTASDSNGNIYEYDYEYGEIYVAGIENVAAQVSGYEIDGNLLIVTGSSDVIVYNLQGMKVAHVASGDSIELVPGVYVLNVNGKSVKILVK